MSKQKIASNLIRIFILSLAFFDKEVFFGYDSLWMYIGLICCAVVLILKSPRFIYIPKEFLLWLIFLIVLLLSSFFAMSSEQVLIDAIRFGFLFVICLGLYQLFTVYPGSLNDLLNFQLWLGIGLAVLAFLQIIEFNFLNSFHLYFPSSNLTYIASGGPGAVVGTISIYRATGTFAEPSWLAYFLLPSFMLSVARYFQFNRKIDLLITSIIGLGLFCTLSFSSIFLVIAIINLFMIRKNFFIFQPSKLIRILTLFLIPGIGIFFIYHYVPNIFSYLANRIQYIIAYQDSSLIQRIDTFKDAFSLFYQHPFLGIGAGNYPFFSPSDVAIDSTYLLLLAETGLIGFIIFLFILGSSFKALLKIKSSLSFQMRWLLLTHILLMITFSWWYHPLLWLNLTGSLAFKHFNKRGKS